jgi:hypothetical protein
MMFNNKRTVATHAFKLKYFALIGFYLFSITCATSYAQTTLDNPQTSKLEVPKVYVGENFFKKREIFRYEKTKAEKAMPMVTMATIVGQKPTKIDEDAFNLNEINAVYAGEIDNEKGTDIVAASYAKAFVLDVNGKVRKTINYNLGTYVRDGEKMEYTLPYISFADVDGDGRVEILGTGAGIGVIFNLEGKTLWRYKAGKEDEEPSAVKAEDVDGDGIKDVIVGIGNRVEVYELATGKIKWTTVFSESQYSHVYLSDLQIDDFDGDGKKDILTDEVLLSEGRKITKKFEYSFHWQGILLEKNKKPTFLNFGGGKLNFIDINKTALGSLEAPLSNLKRKPRYSSLPGYNLYRLDAAQAKLFDKDSKYLVVLASANDDEEFEQFKIVYVYNSGGMLVYQETFDAFDAEMSLLPNADGTESLVITDDGKVNIYTVK